MVAAPAGPLCLRRLRRGRSDPPHAERQALRAGLRARPRPQLRLPRRRRPPRPPSRHRRAGGPRVRGVAPEDLGALRGAAGPLPRVRRQQARDAGGRRARRLRHAPRRPAALARRARPRHPPAPRPLRRLRAGRRRGARVHGCPGVLSRLLVQVQLEPPGHRRRGVVRAGRPAVRLPRHAPLPPLPRRGLPSRHRRVGDGRGRGRRRPWWAWRLMTAAASWKEAALQVVVVSVVLPLVTYPVYAFALDGGQAQGGCLLLLGSLFGFLLPSAGVQLHSAVAATVFYHRCMEQQLHELAIPLTMKVMKLGNTPLNALKLIKGAIA